MEKWYIMTGDPGLKPHVIPYTVIVDAWSRRSKHPSAIQSANELLVKMEQHADENAQPNAKTYTCFINGLWRSGQEDAAEHADTILDRMDHHKVSPDAYTYASILNTWGRSGRMDQAGRVYTVLRRMQGRYEQVRDEKCRPNVVCWI